MSLHETTVPDRVGPYRIEGQLGAGGMGEVFRAHDERLGRVVALKRILHGAEEDPLRRARFLREAQMSAQLTHHAVVRVYDLLEVDGRDWIVMELVAGRPLAELLESGPLEVARALRFAHEIIDGLEAAHNEGIVHRDLKSQNVLVCGRDRVKILDFGLAKSFRQVEGGGSISIAGQVAGTPRAMSPEQVQGHRVDHRSDLFSFGVLVYEMVSGLSPFAAGTPYETMKRVCTHRQPPLSELAAGVSRALAEVVDWTLEKDPAHRPQTARDLRQALLRAAATTSRHRDPPDEPDDRREAVAETVADSQAHVATAEVSPPEAGVLTRRDGPPPRPGAGVTAPAIHLRVWPAPVLPEEPYPLLLPYTHPALLGGREREIGQLLRLLRLPIPILGLHAASGTGKSSLLRAGLVPRLRDQGHPVAYDGHPHEPGLVSRLIGDVLAGSEDLGHRSHPTWNFGRDGQSFATMLESFVRRISEVERLSGRCPIFVLDQLEGLWRAGRRRAQAALGALLAASTVRRPGRESPPCRWLLSYRQEFHGEVAGWLADVLSAARAEGLPGIAGLPDDLSGPERFHQFPLQPLGTPPPGCGFEDHAPRAFTEVIEAPLAIRDSDGSPRYPLCFEGDGMARLAGAFARMRAAHPEAPLTPQLQVVLAHLLKDARGRQGGGPPSQDAARWQLRVPDDPEALIATAIESHLESALTEVFPATTKGAEQLRARALLVLSQLADSAERRREGLPASTLAQALGPDGAEVLDKLAAPDLRLVVTRRHLGEWRYALSHDCMTAPVMRMVEQEGKYGHLLVDGALLELRRLVRLSSALYAVEKDHSTRLSRQSFRLLRQHEDVLLWDEEARRWWLALRARRRRDRRRRLAMAAMVLLLVTWLAQWAWKRAEQNEQRASLFEQIVAGQPHEALRALWRLETAGLADRHELRATLGQRTNLREILETGPAAVSAGERADLTRQAVELLLPLAADRSDDLALLGTLTWALDFHLARDQRTAGTAAELRGDLLRALPSPPTPARDDPGWIAVPGGTFLMGSSPDSEWSDDTYADERPRHRVVLSPFRLQVHEVTNDQFRRLVGDHPGEGNLPARVSWYQAYAYSAWLGGRLPTEAEWEYAARAGCAHEYCDREGRPIAIDQAGWYRSNLPDDGNSSSGPQPVMGLEPNPWGLFDVFGNVWEWTADWFGPYHHEAQADPWGPLHGPGRVMRGGATDDDPSKARSGFRIFWPPDGKSVKVGFRVVLPADPAP